MATAATATITITVIPYGGGTITNSATVAGNEMDPNMADNTAVATTTVHRIGKCIFPIPEVPVTQG
jgi:hypothetical protein